MSFQKMLGVDFQTKNPLSHPHLISCEEGGENLIAYLESRDGVKFDIAVSLTSMRRVREASFSEKIYDQGRLAKTRIYESGQWAEDLNQFGPLLRRDSSQNRGQKH